MASNIISNLCGCGPSCCGESCRPRLSVGVVYPQGTLEALELSNSFGKILGTSQLCGSCCSTDCCRPRLSIGVVYPNGTISLDNKALMNVLCGSCCGTDCCRPRLSVGVVYDGTNMSQITQ
ncbi:hypothetical protein WDU94_012489 [Cyamophila willieti]